MTKSERASGTKEAVHCRRVNAAKTVDEHATCPYCFGKHAEIESGERERFCSFDPEVDPLIYGFPPGVGHLKNG